MYCLPSLSETALTPLAGPVEMDLVLLTPDSTLF